MHLSFHQVTIHCSSLSIINVCLYVICTELSFKQSSLAQLCSDQQSVGSNFS